MYEILEQTGIVSFYLDGFQFSQIRGGFKLFRDVVIP
jgi:hypothetical protein